MKLLALHGNPQPLHHTEEILETYLKGVKASEAEFEIAKYNIQQMRFMPCERCNACKTGRIEDCIIKDDMTEVYKQLIEADVVVFSVPIIYGHLPGKTKSFIDRFYAVDNELFKAKKRKLSILLTYQVEDDDTSGFSEVVKTFEYIAQHFNMDLAHQYGCSLPFEGECKDEQVLDQIYQLGKSL